MANTDNESLAASLMTSLVARNENFDAKVKGDQLGLDLMFRWMRCPTNILRPDISVKWFEKLSKNHGDPQRHYHTLMHLEEIFLYLDLLKQKQFIEEGIPMTAFDDEAIVLATFFHDAIYDVQSSTNEEDSAELFREYVREQSAGGIKMQNGLEAFVLLCIIATKSHQVAADNSPTLSLFLDLDMAVLGKENRAYFIYASLIRKEYHFVAHDVYCEKRADVLEDFLKQPAIYGSQAMIDAFEQRARDNMRSEIEVLRSGRIPDGSNLP